MFFCHVVDGQIKQGPALRPKWWNGIADFDKLTVEQAISYNWLPYRIVDNYGPDDIKINQITEIKETEVVCTFVYRPMTQDEIDERRAREWDYVRNDRNDLLAKSDWTQLADCPLTDGDKAAWAAYRQALRDITTQTDINNLVWPQSPADGIKVASL